MAQPQGPAIDRDRFLRTIDEVAAIGLLAVEAGGGRDRRAFSAADRQARAYFQKEAEASGLSVRLDGAANLSARLDCGDPAAPVLLIGSHLDTVPHGGAYDGALGVLAGLEVLRTLKEGQWPLHCHVEVIDFTDEEGRLGHFFGSAAVAGLLSEQEVTDFLQAAAAYPDDLASMAAQAPGGLTPGAVQAARRDHHTLAGYLELHIEQGPRLEQAGVPIGVVGAIFGRRSWRLTFHGRSDHAGTTPLPLRADALAAAARFIAGAPEVVGASFPNAVVTCGNITVAPGAGNVVPNRATVGVEFRAGSEQELDAVEQSLIELAAQAAAGPGLRHVIEATSRTRPTALDADLQGAIRQAARRCGYATLDLPSGAGHDAMMLAAMTPSAMIFVPSHQGRSHSPDEYTTPDDLVAGVSVLLQAVLALAGR